MRIDDDDDDHYRAESRCYCTHSAAEELWNLNEIGNSQQHRSGANDELIMGLL